MKKRWIALMAAGILSLGAMPVMASELTDGAPSQEVPVEATVANGAVAYTISIPTEIDFGKLVQPADNAEEHNATQTMEVAVTKLTGMDATTQRLAVLLKDSAYGTTGFYLDGQESANTGKSLAYSVAHTNGGDVASGTAYANGYLLTAFSAQDQTSSYTLTLDQNQLYGQDMEEYAGAYEGTLTFYSKIVNLGEYGTTAD
ncbi:MAG: hypothetical protein LUD01_08285 [Clostridiales bacterium]|nr:hypothetical protein [Clostridiales bacterium]